MQNNTVLEVTNMAKIVAIVSSPRKDGNSETIVKAMVEAAKGKGHDVQVFNVAAMKDRRGCIACLGCKKAGKCVLKDEITPALDAIRDADGVILSTAVYFGQPTGQYRLLEDRFYSFIDGSFTPNIAAGKKLAVVVTAGSAGADELASQITGRMVSFFKFEPIGNITMTDGNNPHTAEQNPQLLAQAAEIGSKF
jgi:multimeric flavodoxin WrbA